MAKWKLYIAVSLDGYIADQNHAVDWLDQFSDQSFGYEDFISTVSVIVMGSKTFNFVDQTGEWPYPGLKTYLISNSVSVDGNDDDIHQISGDVSHIAQKVEQDHPDAGIWIVGGSNIIRQFLDIGKVDETHLFIMPILLGSGIPMFPETNQQETLKLVKSNHFKNGVIEMVYTHGKA